MKKLNSRGFSFPEILAVIVIIGMLMLIAIPSVSTILTNSRKQAYLDSVIIQKNVVEQAITVDKYFVYDKETVYYFDYKLFDEYETKGKSPFGEWMDCYVVVTWDGQVNHFYWTGMDVNGWKIDLRKEVSKLGTGDIYHSNSTNFIPGNTIGARDNIVIYKVGNDDPIEQTPSNDVSYEDAVRCFDLEKLSDGTYSIINYNTACGSDVGVPSSVDGNPVTIIGENAFRNKDLTSVTLYYGITELKNGAFQYNPLLTEAKLSSTIKTIGPHAFYNCALENLDLPDGVETIGEWGFANNKIRTVSFPKTLKSIGSYAFYGNLLNEFELKSNATIGGAAFSNNQMPDASALIYKYNASTGETDYTTIIGYAGQSKDVIIPTEVRGVRPLKIESNAFANCGLTSVTIPDSVTTIGSSAFYANKLTSVKLPTNLTYIGSYAFRENYLKGVEWPSSLTTVGTGAFNYNCFPQGQDLIYKRVAGGWDYSTIVSGAGSRRNDYCSGYGSGTLDIPAEKNGTKLSLIVGNAFHACNYTKIKLPNLDDTNKLTIENNAFYHNSVTPQIDGFMYKITGGEIDYSTLSSFAGTRGGTIEIPESSHGENLTTINASFNWTSFTTITVPKYVTSISNSAFTKTNRCNTTLTKIINKSGNAFDWYAITGSHHTKPNPVNFVTGTVSHESGDIQITSN